MAESQVTVTFLAAREKSSKNIGDTMEKDVSNKNCNRPILKENATGKEEPSQNLDIFKNKKQLIFHGAPQKLVCKLSSPSKQTAPRILDENNGV